MEQIATNAQMQHPARRLQTVLLGDDDEGIRHLLSEMLNAEGFHVIEAESRCRAVEIYQQSQGEIDLVLLDMSWAPPSAVDALATLRATNASAKVLLLTGNCLRDAVEETLQKGFNAFIPKPFTMDELLEPLRRIVGMDEYAVVAM